MRSGSIIDSAPTQTHHTQTTSRQLGDQRRSTLDSRRVMPNKTLNSMMTRNITRMVIVSTFISVLGQLPYSTTYIIQTYVGRSSTLSTASEYATILIILSPSLDFFSYYFFNKLFKNVLNGYFRKICCCFISSERTSKPNAWVYYYMLNFFLFFRGQFFLVF